MCWTTIDKGYIIHMSQYKTYTWGIWMFQRNLGTPNLLEAYLVKDQRKETTKNIKNVKRLELCIFGGVIVVRRLRQVERWRNWVFEAIIKIRFSLPQPDIWERSGVSYSKAIFWALTIATNWFVFLNESSNKGWSHKHKSEYAK